MLKFYVLLEYGAPGHCLDHYVFAQSYDEAVDEAYRVLGNCIFSVRLI